MPQRINTLRRKTTNRNDTNQMRAVSAAPVGGSINVYECLTQGLRPGLCRSIALTGLFYVLINYLLVLMRLLSRPPNEMLAYFDAFASASA